MKLLRLIIEALVIIALAIPALWVGFIWGWVRDPAKKFDPIECGGYKTWTDMGDEYDCEYGIHAECGQCIFLGYEWDPRTGKRVSRLRRFWWRLRGWRTAEQRFYDKGGA